VLKRSGAAALAHWRQCSGQPPWRLRALPVCGSTETVLSDWLQDSPWRGDVPRAVVARRQTCGHGQWGRRWQSPPGGVWLSAALPWHGQHAAPGVLGLAVAVALAERLEAFGLPVAIKWPNDLLVDGCKLAGILPRMVHRGSRVRLARVGVGLNVVNRVPPGAIALADCQPKVVQRSSSALIWTAEVLSALDRAQNLVLDPDAVCQATEARLWSRQVRDPDTGGHWHVEGLREDGALLLRQGARTTSWTRWLDGAVDGL